MVRITLDPDEVNQTDRVTLTDGTVVTLADADARTLRRVARQLHTHRSSYESAFDPADDDVAARVATGDLPLDEVAPLHLEVRARLEAARARGGRGAAQVDARELLQEATWTSSSGRVEQLTSFTPTHRRNLLGWLERNSGGLRDRFDDADLTERERGRVVDADPWVAGTPLYRALADLIAAETATDQARDQARQVVRSLEFERRGQWPDR